MNNQALARNLRALIDEATPYRFGQMSLTERATLKRSGPGLTAWSLLVVIALSTALAYAR